MPTNAALVRDNIKSATACKHYFGNDYALYRSYCAQFRTATKDGQQVNIRILPVSLKQYEQIHIDRRIP